jgi:glyoxylase-like metal-dependent hydrolase (beta-lactamase superfamily II)
MTLEGTNSYVLDCGDGAALVIDPGPNMPEHLDALVDAAAAFGATIRYIALTHGHGDHSAGVRALAARTGAPVYAHPQCAVVHDADLPLESDWNAGALTLRVMDAPGHTFDHAIFYEPRDAALFTGDTILGRGTTVVAPPGGAMRPYQRTLERLLHEFDAARVIHGGHGPPIDDPRAKIVEYIEHRRMREEQVIDALRAGAHTIPELVRAIYAPSSNLLSAAMARQILAHLLALQSEGRVVATLAARPMSAQESEMLNPDLRGIVAPEEADEIGAQMRLDALYEYRLVEA